MRLVLDARTASFGALIDYAGVFPPASLTVPDAVAEYRRLRSTPEQWTVGRFLIRASQLEELASAVTGTMERGEAPWNVSVIFDIDAASAVTASAAFHAEMSPAMEITAVEAKAPANNGVGKLLDSIATIDPDVAAFIEVDTSKPLKNQIAEISSALRIHNATGGAKIRCGGVTPDLFPDTQTVAEFLWEAAQGSVPFKATAGLHQPVRHFDADLGVWRHGFVNLLVGSVAASEGADIATVEAIVAEDDASAFAVTASGARWRDLSLPGSMIRRSRMNGFTAYGSCDIAEPLEALESHGFLGEGT